MFPEPYRVALDWLFDRIILDSKIQIKYIDSKNQLADTLTNGNFTRDEWNHLLCLFDISHFSSINCSEKMSKRTQKDSGEERVTAKSKPMMNLVSRCSERTPEVLASTASESPVKTRHESQLPLSPQTEKYDRTVRPVVFAYSSNYSEWNADKNWCSQEWKSDELMEVRTRRPVYEQPPGLFVEHTGRLIVDDGMDSDTVAESDMSLKSSVYVFDIGSICIEGEEFYLEILHSSKKKKTGKDLTMEQMFDISEKLISEQSDEIYGVSTINCSDSAWKHLSLVGDVEVISLQHTKVYVFSDSVLCLGKVNENLQSNIAWEKKVDVVQKVHHNTEL